MRTRLSQRNPRLRSGCAFKAKLLQAERTKSHACLPLLRRIAYAFRGFSTQRELRRRALVSVFETRRSLMHKYGRKISSFENSKSMLIRMNAGFETPACIKRGVRFERCYSAIRRGGRRYWASSSAPTMSKPASKIALMSKSSF